MAKQKEYIKLPGLKRSSFIRQRLLLGKDHLLALTIRMAVEEYRRFYFRDIKAIVVRKVESWKIIISLLGFSAVLFLGLAGFLSRGWAWFFGVMGGLVAIVFVQQLLYGTNTECHLITAVQTEKLPSLYRLRWVKKFLERLTPLIAEAQGTVTTEEIQDGTIQVPASAAARLSPKMPGDTKTLRGRWHGVMIGLLLANALVSSISIDYHNTLFVSLETLLFFCFFISVIIALVRQQNRLIYSPLRRLTWINLVWAIIAFGAGYILSFYMMIRHLGVSDNTMLNQWSFMQAVTDIYVRNDPVLLYSYLFFIVVNLVLGITGSVFLIRHRRLNRP